LCAGPVALPAKLSRYFVCVDINLPHTDILPDGSDTLCLRTVGHDLLGHICGALTAIYTREKLGMAPVLIFDIGAHKGEDAAYYLSRGFEVLAVDADPQMIEVMKRAFPSPLAAGQIILLNAAVSDKDDIQSAFHLSNNSEWSSLRKAVSDRNSTYQKSIKVRTRTLPSLVAEYGLPYYCKLDIEGFDAVCLKTLSQLEHLPAFTSTETECLSEFENGTEKNSLETLNALRDLGYEKFKLVDQRTLTVLEPGTKFYCSNFLDQLTELGMRLKRKRQRSLLKSKLGYDFPRGSTGPFGDDLSSQWLSYELAKENILFHRREFFKTRWARNYSFWCDWHAKLE
jgi:FkbM family methyltransferase